jgi:hypothetical protein
MQADMRLASGTLRQAMNALARRDAWSDATENGLALTRALLDRGRARDAQRVLGMFATGASRSGVPATLIDVAILSGTAWLDVMRLDEPSAC